MTKKIVISLILAISLIGIVIWKNDKVVSEPITYLEQEETFEEEEKNYVPYEPESGSVSFVNLDSDEDIQPISPSQDITQTQEIYEPFSELDPVEVVDYDEDYSIVQQNGTLYEVPTSTLVYSDDYSMPYYTVDRKDNLYKHQPVNYTDPNSKYYEPKYIGVYSTFDTNTNYYTVDGIYFYENTIDVGNYSVATFAFTDEEMEFYKHLPLRAPTQLTPEELDIWINEKNAENAGRPNSGSCYYASNQSALKYNKRYGYDNMTATNSPGEILKTVEQYYGVNASFMLSVSMHESCYGFSNYALSRNNFWGWGAVDSNPDAAYGFANVDTGFAAFAAFLSDFYADPTYSAGNGFMIGDNPTSGCSGSYNSAYYQGNIDSVEDGIGKSWATGCSWQFNVATYYAKLDARFGKQDYNTYKNSIGYAYGNTQIYNKVDGQLVPSTDDYGSPENNQTDGKMEYSFLVTGSYGDYWQIAPTAIWKNGEIYSSNSVANKCDNNGNTDSNPGNTGYIIECTKITHEDFYNGEDKYYEYEIVPNTSWGAYSETYKNNQQYIPKNKLVAFGSGITPITPVWGETLINTEYVGGAFTPSTTIYYADGHTETEQALSVTFKYKPKNSDSGYIYNYAYLPEFRLYDESTGEYYEVYWKNMTKDSNDPHTITTNIPIDQLVPGTTYALQVKPNESEIWYPSLPEWSTNFFTIWTNKPNSTIASNENFSIMFKNIDSSANIKFDAVTFNTTYEFINASLINNFTYYSADGTSKNTEVVDVKFDYNIYRSTDGASVPAKYLPQIKLTTTNGSEVHEIYWKNMSWVDSNTISLKIPTELFANSTSYNIAIKPNENESWYSMLEDNYKKYSNLKSSKTEHINVMGSVKNFNFVNASGTLQIDSKYNNFAINTNVTNASYNGMSCLYLDTTGNACKNTNGIAIEFNYSVVRKDDNTIMQVKYIPSFSLYDETTQVNTPIYWKNVIKIDSDTYKIVIPVNLINEGHTYSIKVLPNSNETYYDALPSSYKNYFSPWSNMATKSFKAMPFSIDVNVVNNKFTFSVSANDYIVTSNFVNLKTTSNQKYYLDNNNYITTPLVQVEIDFGIRDVTTVTNYELLYIPDIRLVSSDSTSTINIHWKNVSKTSNGNLIINIPVDQLVKGKDYYIQLRINENEPTYNVLSASYKEYFTVWTNKTNYIQVTQAGKTIKFVNNNTKSTLEVR